MSEIGLRFLENQAGEEEGYSDPGIETFRGTPFAAIARETGQNSKDAGIENKTVIVTFEKISVPSKQIPDISKYRETLSECLRAAKEEKNLKEVKFFEQAVKTLSRDFISILKISDENTTGLIGPCEKGRPYHALVKSSGISRKETDTSGGSFGIGKNAVFALSDIQTAFYSTVYPEGGNSMFLAQGKSKFRSHQDQNGKQYLSVGYWGLTEGFMPVDDPVKVPDWLRRDKVGTSVYAVGMRNSDNWEHEIIASILLNFFQAVHEEGIRFVVQHQQIGPRELPMLYENQQVMAGAVQIGSADDFLFSALLYKCLLDEKTEIKVVHVPGAGHFCIRLLQQEGFPKRIGILRNGMYITDELGHFGDKFRHFSMHRDFVGLVEPADKEAGVWMKSLENPSHDSLDPERLASEEERRNARKAGKLLASLIRDTVREFAKPESGEETDLEELSRFFDVDAEGAEDENGELDLTTSKVVRPPADTKKKKVAKLPPTGNGEGEEGGNQDGEEDGNDAEEGGGSGGGTGDGDGGTGTRKKIKAVSLDQPRTLVPDKQNARIRRLCFTPEISGQINLGLEYTGVSDSTPIPLKDGGLTVLCRKGVRCQVDVELEQPYSGPLEIYAWTGEEPE